MKGYTKYKTDILSCVLCMIIFNLPATAQSEVLQDDEITEAIELAYAFDDRVPFNDIEVVTQEGIVTLTGTVDNLLARKLATGRAEIIKGVRVVVNQIEIERGSRTDQQVLNDVTMVLETDPATDAYEVKVQVEDGHVTLAGSVDSWQERQLSVEVVESVRGVREVVNSLKVNFRGQRSDGEVQAEIARRLESDIWVGHNLIDVQVSGGKVALKGVVGSAAEKRQAANDAWVVGVKAVDDKALEIKWWGSGDKRRYRYTVRTDEQIRQAVEAAFLYDPRVVSFRPRVKVRGGVVTLTGSVNNLKAKRAAGEDARNAIGMIRVKNLLKVRPTARPGDKALTASVREALERNLLIEQRNLTVAARRGRVFLGGESGSKFEKTQVDEVVEGVQGVVEVVNLIEVIYPYPSSVLWWYKTDGDIKMDIIDRLVWNSLLDDTRIEVKVEDGTATLTGEVDSWLEWRMAGDEAEAGEAREVFNRLVIRSGS